MWAVRLPAAIGRHGGSQHKARSIKVVQSRFCARFPRVVDWGTRMPRQVLTRRSLLKGAAVATGAATLPFVHGAYAAGRLSAFFWDHPTPTVPPAMRKLCE